MAITRDATCSLSVVLESAPARPLELEAFVHRVTEASRGAELARAADLERAARRGRIVAAGGAGEGGVVATAAFVFRSIEAAPAVSTPPATPAYRGVFAGSIVDEEGDILTGEELEAQLGAWLTDPRQGPDEQRELVLEIVRRVFSARSSHLDLSDMSLTSVPEVIFRFSWLKSLNLSSNSLTELPRSMGLLKGLKTLYLTENSLSTLPDEVASLRELEVLSISENKLKDVPPAVLSLISLRELYISGNKLTGLPEGLKNLIWLEKLMADNNKIVSLPVEIAALGCLVELDLSYNRLKALTPAVGSLRELRIVDLSNNRLQGLPKEVGGWVALQVFKASNNFIENLPEEMASWRELKEISVDSNELTALPEAIWGYSQLELIIRDNPFPETYMNFLATGIAPYVQSLGRNYDCDLVALSMDDSSSDVSSDDASSDSSFDDEVYEIPMPTAFDFICLLEHEADIGEKGEEYWKPLLEADPELEDFVSGAYSRLPDSDEERVVFAHKIIKHLDTRLAEVIKK